MQRFLLQCAAVGLVALFAASPASAEKKGGVLRIYMHDSPASMSIHEEALNSAQNPMMAVFNNLVMFDQHVPQNSISTIVPDLATSWAWGDDGKSLSITARTGLYRLKLAVAVVFLAVR